MLTRLDTETILDWFKRLTEEEKKKLKKAVEEYLKLLEQEKKAPPEGFSEQAE